MRGTEYTYTIKSVFQDLELLAFNVLANFKVIYPLRIEQFSTFSNILPGVNNLTISSEYTYIGKGGFISSGD